MSQNTTGTDALEKSFLVEIVFFFFFSQILLLWLSSVAVLSDLAACSSVELVMMADCTCKLLRSMVLWFRLMWLNDGVQRMCVRLREVNSATVKVIKVDPLCWLS